MKKTLKKVVVVLASASLAAGVLSGCSFGEVKEEAETLESEAAEEVETLASEAAEEAETLESEAAKEVETLESEAADEFEKLKGDAEEIITAAKEKISTWISDAKAEIENAVEVTEDDIHEAIDYIDEHIAEPFESGEVTKKITYYAEKLKAMGESDAELAEHEITKLGQNVHDYMEKIVEEGEEVESEAATAIKDKIDEGLATIKADKDKLVTEFHEAFSKK